MELANWFSWVTVAGVGAAITLDQIPPLTRKAVRAIRAVRTIREELEKGKRKR